MFYKSYRISIQFSLFILILISIPDHKLKYNYININFFIISLKTINKIYIKKLNQYASHDENRERLCILCLRKTKFSKTKGALETNIYDFKHSAIF